uniref:Putative LAGLIDADG homing endonuclease n=1 Tax=Nephroselmis astigmatica TaxID=259378 RepID=A0A088CJH0_9CHLO|nr:putative LAGLIDADG homing endonuclease [Nephroselmis astigmatica]YP_009057906.1 putative LAGLIDADG homing endonuclease [Nephroselmis astigmatica]AID67745.1 putative LAGLIDADG homing endonuclease [Nephroselmis astigmatica]AID67746.1 putative LAGLIDADG homing endonuclease [Nephroselmis astigmatica]
MIKNVQNVGSYHQNTPMDIGSYITGFVDGEGCFCISFSQRAKFKTGLEVRPSFSISQNKRSLKALQSVQEYFQCGGLRYSKKDQTYKYEVRSLRDLRKYVIPHFEKYPLQTSKSADFKIFAWICRQIAASKHLNRDFLEEIIEQAYQMNGSGKRKYTKTKLLQVLGKMKI